MFQRSSDGGNGVPESAEERLRGSRLPAALRSGDLVRVVSPSWCGPALFPERFAGGVRTLQAALGVRVQVGRHALRQLGQGAGSRAERAADLNAALVDPEVRAIFWSIGGDVASELLDLVDYEAFRADPKIICGYSDATVLHHALYAACGAVTFYGPAVLTQWAEHEGPDPWTLESFRRAVTPGAAGLLPRSPHLIEEFVDWRDSPPTARRRDPARPRRALREGAGSGPLLVGCLPSMLQLLGTRWMPDYRGHLLVLELPDTGYGMSQAGRDLWQLRNAGLLDDLAGLVVGRPRLFTSDSREQLDQLLVEVTAGHDYPVVTEVEVGHTDPMLTLPNGVRAELAGTDLTVLESAVR